MKYFIISDVHGEYDKLIKALEKNNFNKDTDTIISLGDLFDRGPDSKKVLEFVMSLPNKILLFGNHDRRFRELFIGADRAQDYDKHNGVHMTMQSFCRDFMNVKKKNSPSDINYMMREFKNSEAAKETRKLLKEYFNSCDWAVEFKDLVGTHAWIPSKGLYWNGKLYGAEYMEDWRNSKDYLWDDAVWTYNVNTQDEAFIPDKKLIVGHVHSFIVEQTKRGTEIWGEIKNEKGQCDYGVLLPNEVPKIREFEHAIYIDGYAYNEHGDVLVYVYETDEKPIIYLTDEHRMDE